MSSTPADAGRVFRPRLWPTIATLAGLAVLLSLGTWQLQRMGWKRDLIAHAETQLAAAPTPLPAGDLAGLDYRRVSAVGHYLHDRAFAFGFSAENGRPGGRLITPFALADGRVILVDRGWMPEDLLPPNVPPGLEPAGTVALAGIGRWRGDVRRGWLSPDDTPDLRRWYTWDVPGMARAVALSLESLELILERSEGAAGLPKAEPVTVAFPNDHLSYAFTWYGLALVLLAVYILFSSTKPGVRQP
jgi:surfeit locus 1 family protein